MLQYLKNRCITDFTAMPEKDSSALLLAARAVQEATRSGTTPRPLRGKNLGLLCEEAELDEDGAALFQRAALALGAQVAQLRPGLSARSTPDEVQHTAQLLGRLYDALECVGMPSELVQRIGAMAGVPVFESLSSNRHPIAALALQLNPQQSLNDNRCALMQAVLLGALA